MNYTHKLVESFFAEARERLGIISIVEQVGMLHRAIDRLSSSKPEPLPPFVSVIAIGQRVIARPSTLEPFSKALSRKRNLPQAISGPPEIGGPITLGASGAVSERSNLTLEMLVQVPFADPWIVVLCDLQRVNVVGLFNGVDLVTASLGDCPVGRVNGVVTPGTRLRVLCEAKRP